MANNPLQGSGPISITDLQIEKIFTPADPITMTQLYGLDGNPIVADRYDWNQRCIYHAPLEFAGDADENFAISQWYNYDHTSEGDGTETEHTIIPTIHNLSWSSYGGTSRRFSRELSERQKIVLSNKWWSTEEPPASTIGVSGVNLEIQEGDEDSWPDTVFGEIGNFLFDDTMTNVADRYKISRAYLKIPTNGFALIDDVTVAKIQVTGLTSGTVNGNFVLVYYSGDTINCANWMSTENMNVISTASVAYTTGVMEWTLNSYGLSVLRDIIKDPLHTFQTDPYIRIGVIEEDYDLNKRIFFGVSDVTGDNSTFDTIGNWVKYEPVATTGTVTGGYSDEGHTCMKIENQYVGGENKTMAAKLGEASLPATYDDQFLLVSFDYRWLRSQAGVVRSHVELESTQADRQEFGSGFAEFCMMGSFWQSWSDKWVQTARIEKVNIDTIINDGIYIYSVFDGNSSTPYGVALLVDNFQYRLLDRTTPGSIVFEESVGFTFSTPKLIVTKTTKTVPTVDTFPVTVRTNTTIDCNGEVTNAGGSPILQVGFCYGTSTGPTYSGQRISCGYTRGQLGLFGGQITSLTPNTLYYIRAYAYNSIGLAYGDEVTVTTKGIPILDATTDASSMEYRGDSSYMEVDFNTGGNITSNGGDVIEHFGVLAACTSTTPTITTPNMQANTVFENRTGVFSGRLNQAYYWPYLGYTKMYYRSFAKNSYGYGYGPVKEFTVTGSGSGYAILTSTAATSITGNSATAGGDITSDGGNAVSSRGVCYGTSIDPTLSGTFMTSGSGTGAFSVSLTGLTPGQLYHFRAYATNSAGTAYGSDLTFTTIETTGARIVTTAASSIGEYAATSGGSGIQDGGSSITAKGVCWNTTGTPTTADSKTSDGTGTGTFVSSITGLSIGGTYYVRAYITNAVDTYYGDQINFTTIPADPSIITRAVDNIGTTTARSGGTNIVPSTGGTILDKGICWNTSTNPTISNSHNHEGSGSSSFTSDLTGLSSSTTYYVRAFVQNENLNIVYGDNVSFTTVNTSAPGVEIYDTSILTNTSMTLYGAVYSANGGTITERGFCWSITGTPTTSDDKAIVAGTTGEFSLYQSSGLGSGLVYEIRAYAINEYGTGYSSSIVVQLDSVPTGITTVSANTITSSSFASGGGITSDGRSAVTAKGIVYSSASSIPTLSHSFTSDGTGSTSWTTTVSGLTLSTTYYYRAYATNTYGTTYDATVKSMTTIGSGTRLGIIQTPSPASNATTTTKPFSCTIQDAGSPSFTSVGVCWGTSANPTIAGSFNSINPGDAMSFTINAGNSTNPLVAGTTYYVRCYITNTVGTAYSADYTYVHIGPPVVTITSIFTNVTDTAVLTANVSSDGGASLTYSGVQWGLTSGNYLYSNFIADTAVGSYDISMTGLSHYTKYYLRAVSYNSSGLIGYSAETFFTNN